MEKMRIVYAPRFPLMFWDVWHSNHIFREKKQYDHFPWEDGHIGSNCFDFTRIFGLYTFDYICSDPMNHWYLFAGGEGDVGYFKKLRHYIGLCERGKRENPYILFNLIKKIILFLYQLYMADIVVFFTLFSLWWYLLLYFLRYFLNKYAKRFLFVVYVLVKWHVSMETKRKRKIRVKLSLVEKHSILCILFIPWKEKKHIASSIISVLHEKNLFSFTVLSLVGYIKKKHVTKIWCIPIVVHIIFS